MYMYTNHSGKTYQKMLLGFSGFENSKIVNIFSSSLFYVAYPSWHLHTPASRRADTETLVLVILHHEWTNKIFEEGFFAWLL